MTTRQFLKRALVGLAVLAVLGLAQGTAQAQPPQAPPTDQALEPGPPPLPAEAGQFEAATPPQDQFRGQRGPRGIGGQQGVPPRRGQFQDQRGPRGPQGADPGHTPGECDLTGPHGKGAQGGAMGQRNWQQGAQGPVGPQGRGAGMGPVGPQGRGEGMGPGRPMGPPAFEAIDADGNGAITKAEWDQFHAQRAPRGSEGPDGLSGPGGPRGTRGQRGPEGVRGPRGPRALGQEMPPPPGAPVN